MTVYLDANGNGTSTLARDDGFCALIALAAGAWKVRIITPTDATQTGPAQYATTINGSGPLGAGQDFGLKLPGITLTNIPAAGSAEAASAAGAVVTFLNSTITDPTDPHPTLTFDPPSGSLFPIGTTTVHFTATDHAGNSSVSTFTVTVIALPARVRNISVQKQSSLKHKTISVIIVSFNDALSAGLAQGLGSYSLATIAQGKKSKSVSLASAIDDASSHTVTRTTKKPLVLSPALKLQILGSGLLDALGRPHDGQRGGGRLLGDVEQAGHRHREIPWGVEARPALNRFRRCSARPGLDAHPSRI